MRTGTIPASDLAGGIDLHATIESGQSYQWGRDDGALYGESGADAPWYYTVVEGEVVRVRRTDDGLAWASTTAGDALLREVLRLGDDLHAIEASAPGDAVVGSAYDAHRGLRIVDDPFFPTLIAFICSAQMRVERIAAMQAALRERYGPRVPLDGEAYYGFPTPERLADATEAELRDLGLGYRAPYVRDTARMVAGGELTRDDVAGLDYESARDALTGFVGVGDKVADCVCLFSLGHLEAVPLDTWMQRAIEEHYPDCARGNYADTSRAFRERLGGDYAGYHQTYLFHFLRTGR